MSEKKPKLLVRLLPSLTDVAFLMPILFLFGGMEGAKFLLGDGDTGWHIRAGDWILLNGRVPSQDMFSFTKPGEQWFAWEWLWDVTFAWLHQHWGMAAVVVVSLLLISITFALLFRLIQRKTGNVLIAIALTCLAAAGSTIHWLARPHLVSFVFIVVFYFLLERARDGETRLLVYLPFLTILWTNLHGGFLVGLVMIGAYAVGELLAGVIEPLDRDQRRSTLSRSLPFMLSGAGCFLATFINPYFYNLHLHIYKYLGNPNSPFFRWVSEWQPASFGHPTAAFLELMMFLAVLASVWSLYKRRLTYTLLLLAWMHLALTTVRYVPIFMILAAPIVGEALREVLALIREANVARWIRRTIVSVEALGAEFGAIDKVARLPILSGGAALVLIALFYAPNPPKRCSAIYDEGTYPAKALSVMVDSAPGNIFTTDEWGDYLIYRLYPKTKVFVDGRFDFYGGPFTQEYIDVMNVKYDWEDTLNQYRIDTILLPVDTSLAGALKESRNWRSYYDDGTAILFRSATPRETAANSQPERLRASAVRTGDGFFGDRAITEPSITDLRITNDNPKLGIADIYTRSE